MARRPAKTTDAPELGEPYELESVDKTEAPMEGDTGVWCRYTITQGANTITGYKKGSRTAVTNPIFEIPTSTSSTPRSISPSAWPSSRFRTLSLI